MQTQNLFVAARSFRHRLLSAVTALAVCLYFLAVATGARAGTIVSVNVPNGGFDIIQKPGTGGAITGTFPYGGGSNFTFAPTFGSNVSVGNAGGFTATNPAVLWSDGSKGFLPSATVDVPGWTKEASVGAANFGIQPALPHSGTNELAVNGLAFGNSGHQLSFVSAASLGNIAGGVSYTLQVYAGALFNPDPAYNAGVGSPNIVLDLMANGNVIAPTTSNLSTTALNGSYQLYTETYSIASLAGLVGDSLTIRIGTPNGSNGHQTNFDDVTLTHTTPEPATALLLVVGAVALFGSRARQIRRRRAMSV